MERFLPMNQVRESLRAVAGRVLPRLLTQVCRDPGSPMHGCWDRNWWHYKIRDFPSIILQQGGYALWSARDLSPELEPCFAKLASASAHFWNLRAGQPGAFEEYYPYEQGYPPLAFGTLAMAKLCLDGAIDPSEIAGGLRVAASQLSQRFEPRAANQQVAGLAALAAIRRIDRALVPEADWDRQSRSTLELQDGEGWYMEYDGPDLGYLSVTLDCLWDLADLTGEERFISSAQQALDFIGRLVLWNEGSIGMLNARNTDYLVPYGISRFLYSGDSERSDLSSSLLTSLFVNAQEDGHFFASVDDRYWCHYIGHSLFRSLGVIASESTPELAEKSHLLSRDAQPGFLPSSGYDLRSEHGISLLVALRKGGCFTGRMGAARFSDYGWVIHHGPRELVTHWWSLDWQLTLSNDASSCSGSVFSHRELVSTPWKHMMLRIASRILGRRLISLLKSFLIFKKPASTNISFERRISIDATGITVEDRFLGIAGDFQISRAPRSSKRHVASADSWHLEDADVCAGVSISESRKQTNDQLVIRTIYPAPKNLQPVTPL